MLRTDILKLIAHKRDGGELSASEVGWLVSAYAEGRVPDFQMSAFLMAACCRGMTPAETLAFTLALADSGERLDLSSIPGIRVDKHSTGGVGDKTTLVVAPLVASAGAPVVKISGRSLGRTGGTIDKLEAIPGFRTDLSTAEIAAQIKEIGVAICSQNPRLVPADKKIYALRDATATVESLPLIASSVMSKKLATGCDAVVLDVKAGRGAFMPTTESAVELARAMLEIARLTGKQAQALVTSMDQPLGRAVGCALEVEEAVGCLRGQGPADLEELSLALGSRMLALAGKAASLEQASTKLRERLESGAALAKFRQMVQWQGGDPRVGSPGDSRLPRACFTETLGASEDGFITDLDAGIIGDAVRMLASGAGLQAPTDHSAGVILHAKTGERVAAGQPVLTVHGGDPSVINRAMTSLKAAVSVGPKEPATQPLIRAVVEQQMVD